MALQLGDEAPDFEAETTQGRIRFHDWIGDSWAILFSHPKNFTPVCTTELGYMAKIKPDFDSRNVKIIGLSTDPVSSHVEWAKDIEETQGTAPNYPSIGDSDFNVAKLYGMLPASTSGDPLERTAADNQTVRNVFVIGPDKKIKLILVYPMTTGRNFDEVLRVIDSLQLTANHKVATPVNWQQGEDVIIAGSVTDEAAKETYPDGWKAPKPYIRIVPQPHCTRLASESAKPVASRCRALFAQDEHPRKRMLIARRPLKGRFAPGLNAAGGPNRLGEAETAEPDRAAGDRALAAEPARARRSSSVAIPPAATTGRPTAQHVLEQLDVRACERPVAPRARDERAARSRRPRSAARAPTARTS